MKSARGLLCGMLLVGGFLVSERDSDRPLRAADTPAAAAEAEVEMDYGTITGQILLDGDIPEPRLVFGNGAKVNDPKICAAADYFSDELVVDPVTKGIANVFVYLPKADKVHPALKASAEKEVEFDQKVCRFTPHALFVRTDQTVLVKSSDDCKHNLRVATRRNSSVNFIVPNKDRAGQKVKFKSAENVPMPVNCDLHTWMTGYWLILDHPYAAISDDKGRFTIRQLPAGEYTFRVWHELPGYLKKELTVKVVGGKTTDLGKLSYPVGKFEERIKR